MKGYIESRKITCNSITNEYNPVDQNKELSQNPAGYYAKLAGIFYKRQGEQTDTARKITPKHLFMLQEIKHILTKNNTRYRVVISPLYEQKKFSPYDMGLLKALFGQQLYDFSGKNQFTEHSTNYYESSHYMPKVGDSILQRIYQKELFSAK